LNAAKAADASLKHILPQGKENYEFFVIVEKHWKNIILTNVGAGGCAEKVTGEIGTVRKTAHISDKSPD
jgi:hypothetical protein